MQRNDRRADKQQACYRSLYTKAPISPSIVERGQEEGAKRTVQLQLSSAPDGECSESNAVRREYDNEITAYAHGFYGPPLVAS